MKTKKSINVGDLVCSIGDKNFPTVLGMVIKARRPRDLDNGPYIGYDYVISWFGGNDTPTNNFHLITGWKQEFDIWKKDNMK
jgi:hypothetical protein